MPKTTITETTEYVYDNRQMQAYKDQRLVKKVKTTVIETELGGVVRTHPYGVNPNGVYVGDVPGQPQFTVNVDGKVLAESVNKPGGALQA